MTPYAKDMIRVALGLILMFAVLFLALAIAGGCAAGLTAQQKAIQAAEISFESYARTRDLVVPRIAALEAKSGLTDEEARYKAGLYKLGAALDTYRAVHNTYIMALRLGDSISIEKARTDLRSVMLTVIDLAQVVRLDVGTWRMP